MRATLLHFNLDIKVSEDEKYNFVIAIASGNLRYMEIVDWIKSKLIETS